MRNNYLLRFESEDKPKEPGTQPKNPVANSRDKAGTDAHVCILAVLLSLTKYFT